MLIDTNFDFRTDSHDRDPDTHSSMLKQYHKLLWTKPLPSGQFFVLSDKTEKRYLVFENSDETHFLTSDSIVNSLSHHKGKVAKITAELDPDVLKTFRDINSTIGGFLIFPGNRKNGKATINGERGFNHYVADRFDLTLECIKKFYEGKESPLSNVLNRYSTFFRLFESFRNYVNFFLLNDLVSDDFSSVRLFIPNDLSFQNSPLPSDIPSYMKYRANSIDFVVCRNQRIKELSVIDESIN